MASALRSIRNEPERIWTSTEVYEIFIAKGATETSRVRFLYSFEEKRGKIYCILKGSGVTAICIHKEKAALIFKVTYFVDDPDEEMIIKVAKMIKADIEKKKHNVSIYSSLKKDTLNKNSSDALSFLLSQISPKFKDSLVALLMNHMVTSIAANTFSMLQLALGLRW